jgi:hypothetical protein
MMLVLSAAMRDATAPLGCEAEVDGAREAPGLVCLVQSVIHHHPSDTYERGLKIFEEPSKPA